MPFSVFKKNHLSVNTFFFIHIMFLNQIIFLSTKYIITFIDFNKIIEYRFC